MIRALIFDYNQVLADDLQAHIKAYDIALKNHGLKVSIKELREIMHKTRNQKIEHFQKKHGLKESEMTFFAEKEKEFFRIARTTNLLFPGTEKVLEALAKKYSLAIVTATNKEQMFLPKETEKLFKAIITITDYKKPKPDPEGLQKAIAAIGMHASDCAYIGDSLHDMAAAKNAGCKPIGMATGIYGAEELRKAGAEIVIAKLKELEKIKL